MMKSSTEYGNGVRKGARAGGSKYGYEYENGYPSTALHTRNHGLACTQFSDAQFKEAAVVNRNSEVLQMRRSIESDGCGKRISRELGQLKRFGEVYLEDLEHEGTRSVE
ncbi:hypothetical protein K438DRAFT_1784326 [Mycena galopus ATCC 62051]|nr:hypothetical protein K438DRAFT_1784326 [Mycena galopus ATCC 62051]